MKIQLLAKGILLRSISIICVYSTSTLLKKNLSSEEFGLFYFGMELILYLILITTYGHNISIIKNINIGNQHSIFYLYKRFQFTISISAIIIGVFLIAALTGFPKYFSLQLFTMSLALIPLSLTKDFSSYLNAKGLTIKAYFLDYVPFKLIFLGLILINLKILTTQLSVFNIYLLTAILTMTLGFLIVSKDLSKVRIPKVKFHLNDFKKFRELGAINVIGKLGNKLPIFIIPFILGPEEVGNYIICLQIALAPQILYELSNTYIAPRIKDIGIKIDVHQIKILIQKTNFILLFITLIYLVLVLIFMDKILSIWDINTSLNKVVLILLLLTKGVNIFFGSNGLFLTLNGEEDIVLRQNLISTILALLLIILFAYYYGLIGATFGALISIVYLNLKLTSYIYHKYDFLTIPKYWIN